MGIPPSSTAQQRQGPRYWRGSWIAAAVCLLVGIAAARSHPEELSAASLWPPALVLLWLGSASWLIDWAVGVADRFRKRAASVLGDGAETAEIAEIELRRVFGPPALLRLALPLVLIGATVVLLLPQAAPWKAFRLLLAGSCLYYASFGIWGAHSALRRVCRVVQELEARGLLNLYHPDQLAGLGFARRLADEASAFVFSGVAAFPLGVLLAREGLAAGGLRGHLAAALAAALILTWGVTTVHASLRGRLTISRAVENLQGPVLDQIATEKRSLLESGGEAEQLRRCELKEAAAERLRPGVFAGAGGWRDLASVAASLLALWRIVEGALP